MTSATSELIRQPHDKFFREAFSYHQTAHDFLNYYLPQHLNQHFDLSTLEISKETFIDSTLHEHASDVLYQLTLNTGEQYNIYILFEHKSYPDEWVAFQLLRYMLRIWEQQKKQEKAEKGRKPEPLVPILPLIIYHGDEAWPVAPQFNKLFADDLPPALRDYLPNFRYWILDLSQYPEAEIKGWAILQSCLRLLKYARSNQFTKQFSQSLQLVLDLPQPSTARQFLETMLRYAVSAARETTQEELTSVVNQVLEQGEGTMMTIAERWLEEGKQVGFEEGFEKGQAQELLGVLRRTLPRLFNDLPSAKLFETLKQLSLEQLRQATDLAFDTPNLADFDATVSRWAADNARSNRATTAS